jgi:hypothetical protein
MFSVSSTLCEGIRERQSSEHLKRSVAFKINRNPGGPDEGLKEARWLALI